MKDKRFLKLFLSMCMALCIAFCLFCLNVYADQNEIYYLTNVIDFTRLQVGDYNTDLTNYNLNFNAVDGYLKNDINYGDGSWTGSNFVDQSFVNNDFVTKWVNSVNNDYNPSITGYININGVESPDIVVNGQVLDRSKYKTVIATNGGANMPSGNYFIICSVYVPDNTICFLEQGRLMTNSQEVYYAYNVYNFIADGDYLIFSQWQSASNGSNSAYTSYDFNQDSTPDLYQLYVTLNGWFYSDLPVYYSWANHSNDEGIFLNQSPYFYGDYNGRGGINNSVGKYVLSGEDTTGFIVDRRTESMINNNDEIDQIIQDGFDPLLFNGTLGFNWFSSNGSVNYVSSLDQFKPFVQLKYKINNYTDIHKDDVSIVWDSTINMKLTYADSDGNGKFITSCKYDASGTWDLVGHENQFTLLASQESNLYTLRNVRSTGGSNFYGGEFKDNQNINQNITYGISAYRHDNDVVTNTEEEAYNFVRGYFANNNKGNDTLDSYGFIYFNVYLKNSTTGETSKIYSSVFDLFNNKFQDNSSDLVNNDDSAYNDFVNSFNYLDQNGDLSLVDYAKPYNNNNTASGGQSIVTITNPQFPYLLVDIPEGDWMNKTPNLTGILSDFKNALEEVHDESILPVMAETYNYLPSRMWQYLVYGVELLLMVGIWRGITRR